MFSRSRKERERKKNNVVNPTHSSIHVPLNHIYLGNYGLEALQTYEY